MRDDWDWLLAQLVIIGIGIGWVLFEGLPMVWSAFIRPLLRVLVS